MYHSTVVHGGSFVTFFCNQNWPLLFSKNANNHAFDKKMMIEKIAAIEGSSSVFLID